MPGTTKNDEGREFPLIPEPRTLLDEHRLAVTKRLERTQGRVIARVFHRRGQPIKSLRRSWLTVTKAAGRPGTIPARPAALGRAEPRARRRQPLGRHEADRAQDGGDLPAVRDLVTNDPGEVGAKLAALGDNPGAVTEGSAASWKYVESGGQGRD